MSRETLEQKFERRHKEGGSLKALTACKGIMGDIFRNLYIKRLKSPRRKEELAKERIIKEYPGISSDDILLALQEWRTQESERKTRGLEVYYKIKGAKSGKEGRNINDRKDMNASITRTEELTKNELPGLLEHSKGKTATVYFSNHGVHGKQANCIINEKGELKKGLLTFVEHIDESNIDQDKVGERWKYDRLVFTEESITAIVIEGIRYTITDRQSEKVGQSKDYIQPSLSPLEITEAGKEVIGIINELSEIPVDKKNSLLALIISKTIRIDDLKPYEDIIIKIAEKSRGIKKRMGENIYLAMSGELSLSKLFMSYIGKSYTEGPIHLQHYNGNTAGEKNNGSGESKGTGPTPININRSDPDEAIYAPI